MYVVLQLPAKLPDLNPVDYNVSGVLQENVYQNAPLISTK